MDSYDFFLQAFDVAQIIARHKTESEGIVAKRIAEQTGIPERTIADITRAAMRRGFPIVSGAHGYWMAQSEEQFKAHWEKERGRVVAILKARRDAMKNHINAPTILEVPETELFEKEVA
jgi:hypothetical protein